MKKDGPCLVLAGPGSGKTAVLTRRVFELIKSGIPANEILVITFTKAAAIEMKERFDRLSDDYYPVNFGTFHSLFWGILQKELGFKSSDILMSKEKTRVLKEAMSIARLDTDDSVLMNAYISELTIINCSLTNMDDYEPKFVDKNDLILFARAYEALKTKYRLIDFDDMLIKAYKLFKEKPELLNKWQNRFSYILVDEMQDMNDIQFILVQMLSGMRRNLFCVGDDDQSIYGFRGANPKLMQDFMNIYPDAEKILLDCNYRCPKNIVKSAGEVISHNKLRFSKDINSFKADGTIKVNGYLDEEDEAKHVINTIISLQSSGVDTNEIAILYRNHSDARYIVDGLLNAKIPFYLKENMPNIYSHFIISDIESYFQIAIGNSTKARLLSVLNRPNRYLHRRSVEIGAGIEGMLKFYADSPMNYEKVLALKADINLIKNMSPNAAIAYIKNVMGYDSFLKEEALRLGAKYSDYQEILTFLSNVLKDTRTLKQAIDKLNILKLKVDFENKNKTKDKADKVGLYTLHSSKGLEFDNVFIIAANEGTIPTNKAESKEDIEAERRLFYVGVTRAKSNLYISYTNKKNREKSRFITEMNYSDKSSL